MPQHWHEDDFRRLTADEVRAYCAASPAYVGECDDFGYTPLIGACLAGKTEVTRVLLEAGADPNFEASDGMTPLRAAIPAGERVFDRALFDLLLNAGARPNTGLEPPLHDAVCRGLTDLVAYLVEHGADPNFEDGDGSTPLFWAGAYGKRRDVAMMRLLVRLGADVERRDGIGRTLADYVGAKVMRELTE